MKILFTGGGTLGPVTPLLAIAEELKKQGAKLYWIGTRKGPERKLVEDAGIRFSWLYAPKWRRYFDLRNLFVPLALHLAAKIAWFKLLRMRPDVIVTAGGFVGVPVVWAAWWLRIPSVLHNQDVRWSLANKLVAPFVKKITYALPETVPARWKDKSVWTGNPIRRFVLEGNKKNGLKLCGFSDRVPTIMVVGGGTGAKGLNEIVWEALPALTTRYQIIHLTGRGKHNPSQPPGPTLTRPVFDPLSLRGGDDSITPLKVRGEGGVMSHYFVFEFVTSEMGDLLAAADLVITRAGMGFLTELAALGKPMVIVPIPGSHQEDNARYFEKKGAAVVLEQTGLHGEALIEQVDRLFHELGTMQEMAQRAGELLKPNAATQIAEEIMSLQKNNAQPKKPSKK